MDTLCIKRWQATYTKRNLSFLGFTQKHSKYHCNGTKKKGYVQLEPIKGQKREMTIGITEEGKQYAKIKLQPIYEREKKVFHHLTDEDMQVVEALNKLAKLLCE